MTQQEIIDFTLKHYGDNRRALVPLLRKRLKEEDCRTEDIYNAMQAAIRSPMHAQTGSWDEIDRRILSGRPKLSELGDTSDQYMFVVNPEIKSVTDWGFSEILNNNGEVRIFRLWINWLMPVYYLEGGYYKGLESGKFEQWGPLNHLNVKERLLRKKIQEVLSHWKYQAIEKSFLMQRFPSLSSDIIRKNASLFECLFSDVQFPFHEHIIRNNTRLQDEYDPQLTYRIWRYLNENQEVIRTERTFYFKGSRIFEMNILHSTPGDKNQGILRPEPKTKKERSFKL